ncbi:hypothetical protein GA0115255_107156, partial [Streptomyces sp. Ncost-T6T-2b]
TGRDRSVGLMLDQLGVVGLGPARGARRPPLCLMSGNVS